MRKLYTPSFLTLSYQCRHSKSVEGQAEKSKAELADVAAILEMLA
jgi:hypothetical protein